MAVFAPLLSLALTVAPADAPVRESVQRVLLSASETPQSLLNARRFSDQLRFEEAVVEYQRYLNDPNRPIAERARALLELGFLHLVLGDELNARRRTFDALELDPKIKAAPGAPQKQLAFLTELRKEFEARPKLEVLPRVPDEPPQQVRVKLVDPQRSVKRLLLRHSTSPSGPYYGAPLSCAEGSGVCTGEIPSPPSSNSYTSWYYAEALDAEGNTLTQAANPSAPLQLSVIQRSPWYKSPWVWGGGAALVVGVAAVIFATSASSPPSR